MVRAEMTFAASLRLTCLRNRETMAGMAGAATARAPIGVDPADAGVRPRCRVELAVRQHFHCRPVTLETADRDGRRTADDFTEEIVERGENFACLGVVTPFLLINFVLVATPAIFRRDDDGDRRAIMLEGIAVGFFRPVAVVAADALLPVGAGQPFWARPGLSALWHWKQVSFCFANSLRAATFPRWAAAGSMQQITDTPVTSADARTVAANRIATSAYH